LHGSVKIIRLQTKVKSLHSAVGPMSQLQNGIAKFQISDPEPAGGGLLKIMAETKVPFIEDDGAVEIADMNGYVIDALKH
jgi:hypothetical protein